MTTHEVLVAARNGLAQVGWCRKFGSPAGPMCVVHAVFSVGDTSTQPLRAIAAVIGCAEPYGMLIGDWNDNECADETEALGVLDCAIAATAPEPDTSFLTEAPEPARV